MNDLYSAVDVGNNIFNTKVAELVPNITAALVIIFFGIVFYLVTAQMIEAALKRTHMQLSLIRIVVRSIYRGVVAGIVLIFVLGEMGINVTAALAGVGVLGIAAGFAAQQTLANVFSGFGIFIDHLYKPGDWVVINDHIGEVVSITLRTTKIRTLDNTYVSIPNSLVTSSAITNYTERGMVRVSAKVAIPYEESVDKARKVLIEAVSKIEAAKEEPGPEVVVGELADSGVNLIVRIWIDNARFEQRNGFILLEECKKALDAAGITIPFPQRDIHVISGNKSRIAR